jgi:hypothetical protein
MTLPFPHFEQHYPAVHERRADAGRPVPEWVQEEGVACLDRGRLEEGFLRVRCEIRRADALVAFSHRCGFGPSCDARSQT